MAILAKAALPLKHGVSSFKRRYAMASKSMHTFHHNPLCTFLEFCMTDKNSVTHNCNVKGKGTMFFIVSFVRYCALLDTISLPMYEPLN